MNFFICPNGHRYNPKKYDSCPHCKLEQEKRNKSKNAINLTAERSAAQGAPQANLSELNAPITQLGPRTRIQLPKADFEDEQVTDTIIMPDPRYKADVAAPATQLGQPSPTGTIVIFEREQPESAKDQLVPLPVVAWLVIVEGIGKGRDFRLVKGQNFIGRDRDMEVSLDFGPQSDTKVSKRNHAVIIFDQTRNECFIDSRSDSHKNLPLLNGSTILSLTSLKDGDIIQVADTKFRFVPLCGPAFSWS